MPLQDISLCVACGCNSSLSMISHSFVIDLVHLNEVTLNEDKTIASVGGGAYLKEVDAACAPYNLGITAGNNPFTGVGGLTLAGGYGWLARRQGLAVDSFISAEVVLSNGDIVKADDQGEYKDLMWGLRGGGGNFGIVTQFHFRTTKLPSVCMAGSIVYLTPLASTAKSIAVNFDRLYNELPDNVSGVIVFAGGKSVVPTAWCYFGEENDPAKVPVLVKAGALGGWATVKNDVKPVSYHNDAQKMFVKADRDPTGYVYQTIIPFGSRNAQLPENLIEELVEFARVPMPHGVSKGNVILTTVGGKASHIDDRNVLTCVPLPVRKARYFALIQAFYQPELGEFSRNAARDWAKVAHGILSPYRPGEVHYAPDEVNPGFTETAYFGEELGHYSQSIYVRLGQLKAKYDKENFFCNNYNIEPISKTSSHLKQESYHSLGVHHKKNNDPVVLAAQSAAEMAAAAASNSNDPHLPMSSI